MILTLETANQRQTALTVLSQLVETDTRLTSATARLAAAPSLEPTSVADLTTEVASLTAQQARLLTTLTELG